eukprot:3941399-Rhodomonas_salina.1
MESRPDSTDIAPVQYLRFQFKMGGRTCYGPSRIRQSQRRLPASTSVLTEVLFQQMLRQYTHQYRVVRRGVKRQYRTAHSIGIGP